MISQSLVEAYTCLDSYLDGEILSYNITLSLRDLQLRGKQAATLTVVNNTGSQHCQANFLILFYNVSSYQRRYTFLLQCVLFLLFHFDS